MASHLMLSIDYFFWLLVCKRPLGTFPPRKNLLLLSETMPHQRKSVFQAIPNTEEKGRARSFKGQMNVSEQGRFACPAPGVNATGVSSFPSVVPPCRNLRCNLRVPLFERLHKEESVSLTFSGPNLTLHLICSSLFCPSCSTPNTSDGSAPSSRPAAFANVSVYPL